MLPSFLNTVVVCLCGYLLMLTESMLVVKPQSTTANLGQRVEMNCSSDLSHPVDWNFIANDKVKHEIYSSGEISPDFKTQYEVTLHPNGVYSLIISEFRDVHSGEYICIDNEGLGPDSASANLTVFKESNVDHSSVRPLDNSTGNPGHETHKTTSPPPSVSTDSSADRSWVIPVAVIIPICFVIIIVATIAVLCKNGKCSRRRKKSGYAGVNRMI